MTLDDVEFVQQAHVSWREIGHVESRLVGQEWIPRGGAVAGRHLECQLANDSHTEFRPVIGHGTDVRGNGHKGAGSMRGGGDAIGASEQRLHRDPPYRKLPEKTE